MCTTRTVFGITGTGALAVGAWFVIQYYQKSDCADRYWCGNPPQDHVGYGLIVIGIIMQCIRSLIL